MANSNHRYSLVGVVIYISCLRSFSLALTLHRNHGQHVDHLDLTFDLIHRDSPKSPFYNSSQTLSDRLSNAFRRSLDRSQQLARRSYKTQSGASAESTLSTASGEYLMELSLGSPPTRLLVVMDTGSDIMWTQCQPCTNCYNQTAPIFDPRTSKSFKTLGCESHFCFDISGDTCQSPGDEDQCTYAVFYADGSYTKGIVNMDTLRLGEKAVSFTDFGFGCGYDNQGLFQESWNGIVGLGNAKGSLVSQLGSYGIAEKFSYCLVSLRAAKLDSTIRFGDSAVVSGRGTVSVPMVDGPDSESIFYKLFIKAISVGNKTIALEQRTIIDSGTTLTVLPRRIFSQLVSAVAKKIHLERVADPGKTLSLCYKTSTADPGRDFPAPTLTVHYDGGNVMLSSMNTFVRVSKEVVCFSMVAALDDNTSIIGNLAQMNFLVGYDRINKSVSFKPTDCTKI